MKFVLIVIAYFVCNCLAQDITPLSNGVAVNGNVKKEELDYYSVASEQTGGLIVQLTQLSGTIYLFIGQDFVPTLSNYTGMIANTNSVKNYTVPITTATFYIGVYGYSAGSYQIVGWGNTPVNQLSQGQVVQGSQNNGESTLYFFTIPANVFDMLVIVQASAGDPDQFIYNQIPGPGVNPVWSNGGSGTLSCVFVSLPPADTYYYVLRAATGPYTYSTAMYENHGNSCSFAKENVTAVTIVN